MTNYNELYALYTRALIFKMVFPEQAAMFNELIEYLEYASLKYFWSGQTQGSPLWFEQKMLSAIQQMKQLESDLNLDGLRGMVAKLFEI